MNCRRFQNLLLEYLDGSLSPTLQARADAHLAGCEACRQVRRQQEFLAQAWSERFQRETASLVLGAETERHILAAISDPTPHLAGRPRIPEVWDRFAWPLGIAAAALFVASLGTGYPFGRHGPGGIASGPGQAVLAPTVSIHLSESVPRHCFQWNGDVLTDSITFDTCVVDQTF